ncbi:MAG: hypothetical protein ACFFE8_17415 [Candidatus Heimdallarchaeota archaeon]
MSNQNKTIKLSNQLFELLEKKSSENNFKTVDEYVEQVLSQILQVDTAEKIDPKEEEEIKARLERLGYL